MLWSLNRSSKKISLYLNQHTLYYDSVVSLIETARDFLVLIPICKMFLFCWYFLPRHGACVTWLLNSSCRLLSLDTHLSSLTCLCLNIKRILIKVEWYLHWAPDLRWLRCWQKIAGIRRDYHWVHTYLHHENIITTTNKTHRHNTDSEQFEEDQRTEDLPLHVMNKTMLLPSKHLFGGEKNILYRQVIKISDFFTSVRMLEMTLVDVKPENVSILSSLSLITDEGGIPQ